MALDLSSLDEGLGFDKPATTSGAPAWAAPCMFEEDPDNPRFETDDTAFAALVEDVRQHGILQPIVVRPTDGKRLRIRFGMRRFRAACIVGLSNLPYVVTEDTRQFDDFSQVSENEMRLSLQPLELATFIEKKIAAGMKRKAIADKLQIDASAVTHLLALVGNPPKLILELYHSRKCRSPAYLYELRLLLKRDPELVENLCNQAVGIDRHLINAIADAVTDSGRPPEREKAKPPATDRPGPDESIGPGTDKSAEMRRLSGALPVHRIRKPELLGLIGGDHVALDLHALPSAPGKIVASYADGRRCEVDMSSVVFTLLRDASA
jgi:ParB family transcriptional regulator, chromosome partitioning protein